METLADRITSSLRVLVGQPISDCRRALNMQMFGFGPRLSTTDRKGRPTLVSELSLHVQCRWRFADALRILFGRDDLYHPADSSIHADEFDWQTGDSLLDALQRDWFERRRQEPTRVLTARGDRFGGFRLELEGQFSLECFPCGAGRPGEYSEHWRLFSSLEETPHFVITTAGVDDEPRGSSPSS